jgi:hypothetical protein
VTDAALRQRLGRAARQAVIDRDLTWDGNARRAVSLAKAEIARRHPAKAP